MTPTAAELSSMAATVEDLARRISPIAQTYEAAHREDLAGEALEVERVLQGALRRLTRLAGSPGA